MSQARRVRTPMTVEEFHEWAARQPGRWELVHGEPRAMAPPSWPHSLIQARAASLIDQYIDASGRPCRVGTEVGIIPASFRRTNARSADLAVSCAPVGEDGRDVTDPVFILEVLSPFNEPDTRDNVWAYMTLPSVMQIVLLHSTRMAGESFARTRDGAWPDEATLLGADDVLRVEAIGWGCPVRAFYARTSLVAG